MPAAGSSILQSSVSTKDFSDSGANSEWNEALVAWRTAPQVDAETEAQTLAYPVSKAISIASSNWSDVPVVYKRYAAFTVIVTFQGKTVGPYNALFLFGVDSYGNEVIANNDLISGNQALWDVLKKPLYPTGLIQSKLRDVPIVANWIRANEMSSLECKEDLCCSHGGCGLSTAAVNRDLSKPLPQPLPANLEK